MILIGVVAAAAGWWWWRRRSGLPFLPVGSGSQLPPPVYNDGAGSPLYPYANSAANTSPGALPPVTPTAQPGWKDQLASGYGTGVGITATLACAAYGLGPLCAAAAPVGNLVGTYTAKGAIAAGGYTVTGAKAVASATKTGLKAIIPFW